jgi:hypothetical protein
MFHQRVLLLALCAAMTSCDEGSGCVEGNCGDWGCNTNAASINGTFFHELNINGIANSEGMTAERFFHQEDGPDLILKGDRLEGEVDGATMHVLLGKATYALTIDGAAEEVRFWTGGGTVPAYRISYRQLGVPQKEEVLLCSGSGGDVGGPGVEFRGKAILFGGGGDRYDARGKRVLHPDGDDALDPGWFNIACSGFVTAKIHLLRYTEAASASSVRTTWSERQAMLKMLTADYCGEGHAFTENNVPLRYRDRRGLCNTIPDEDLGSVRLTEAIWNERGAVCLNHPRMGDDTLGDVYRECDIPWCGDSPEPIAEQWRNAGQVISANAGEGRPPLGPCAP